MHHLNRELLGDGLKPTCRSMPLGSVAGLLALAAAPAVITAARGGTEFSGALTLAVLVAGAVPAFAVGEPARAVCNATPTPAFQRLGARLSVLLAATVATAVVVAVAARSAGPRALDHVGHTVPELAAVAALSLAAGTVAERRSQPGPALVGAITGPIAVLVVTAFAYRWEWLPALGSITHARRWWTVAAAACAVVAYELRDRTN